MYTHHKQLVTAGLPLVEAKTALVVLHGRGSNAQDGIALAKYFKLTDAAVIAPQATNNSWYPQSFMAPQKDNEPALSTAIKVIGEIVEDIKAAGITAENIYFAGFSQGACLTLEYITRNVQRYGGAVALTGGLIGRELNMANYKGNFKNTPVLITTGDPDPHVPVTRVEVSEGILKKMGADVTMKIYAGRPHTIGRGEIDLANQLVFAR